MLQRKFYGLLPVVLFTDSLGVRFAAPSRALKFITGKLDPDQRTTLVLRTIC